MKTRFFLVFAVFIALYGGICARLYAVQIHGNDLFTEEARGSQADTQGIAERGQIFFTDRSGSDVPVALVKDYPSIFVSPRDVQDPGAAASLTAPIVHMDAGELAKKIAEKKEEGSEYLLLLPRATDEEVVQIENLKLKGVSIENRQGRYYPFKELGAHVVGFVDKRGETRTPEGLYGIEKMFDAELARGEEVHLTIDRAIEDTAEGLLENLVAEYGAAGGTIIVQNPKTGEILAMASNPTFDPNEYNQAELKNFLNPAVQLIYEPGSVFKPLTLAAGLDSGALTPETAFVDTGSFTLNGMTIHNFEDRVYGKITMREMIQNSINTGAIYAERLTGHQTFYKYLSAFGFTEKTGVSLPGEIVSNLRNLVRKDVRAIDFGTAAYGQGVSVTPLAMINAFSALANDGVLMKPYILKSEKPEVVHRVVKPETAKTVREILASTVVKNRVAVIPNYNIAGKTGTAFIADPKSGRYTEEMIHTFIGFAPATDPKFTVLVKLERPAHGEAAGLTVVPTFKKLAEFLLNYYHIPPDNLEQ
jgi:cell division protein FtsI/penicillin-binding protein 2